MKDIHTEIFTVEPSRLASGTWCHKRERTIGEGDIRASYSADRIGMGQPVRKPFAWRGGSWVCTGIRHCRDDITAEAYRLVPLRFFEGKAITYGERVKDVSAARDDPKGFRHGMIVRHGGKEFVLSGPPASFTPGRAAQFELF